MKDRTATLYDITRATLRFARITVLGIGFAVGLSQATYAQTVTPPPVPPGLEVSGPDQAFLVGHATGTQNYVCQPSDALGHVAWTLFTPEATLFGEQQEQLITHFFSPNPDEQGIVVRATWEDSRDTSMVWARAVAAATVDPTAIPWVKLVVVGSQPGPTGGTTLSDSTFVQRLNTTGGLAPATGCDQLPDVGRKAFVPYTADYFFYKK